MKRIILFFSCFLFCSLTLQAQLTQLNIDASAFSIVRSVDREYVLLYTETASSDGWFLLYRDGNPSAMAFQVVSGVQVRDIKIYADRTAYFCGTYNGGTMGLVGKFDIFPTFAGTGTVDYGVCDWSIDIYKLKPTNLKRLELFDSAGMVGMAMVGESLTDLGSIKKGTTVASAWFDTQWHLCGHVNKGNAFYFTDIACLEHSIVAVGTDSTGRGCLVKTFMPALHFPEQYYVFTPQFASGIDFLSPVGTVLVTRAGVDSVLIVHHDDNANVMTVLHKMGIHPVTGSPITPINTWITDISSSIPYSSGWNILELAYCDQAAYLLQNAEFPYASGLAHRLSRIPTLSYPSTADFWLPTYGIQQSMDLDIVSYKPRLSCLLPRLGLYAPFWIPHTVNCYLYSTLPVLPTSAVISNARIDDEFRHPMVYTYPILPTIVNISAEVFCQNND